MLSSRAVDIVTEEVPLTAPQSPARVNVCMYVAQSSPPPLGPQYSQFSSTSAIVLAHDKQ